MIMLFILIQNENCILDWLENSLLKPVQTEPYKLIFRKSATSYVGSFFSTKNQNEKTALKNQ